MKLEDFPKSERTFLKKCRTAYQLDYRNDWGHPCEYVGYDRETDKAVEMVKYYKGRLLALYGLGEA